MHMTALAVSFLASVQVATPVTAERYFPATVSVVGGEVRGVAADDVESWKGIPYAAPPIGTNRWRAPQPVNGWSGIRDARKYGHDCMQKPFPSDAAPLGTEPSEDCLVLNVWRPKDAKPGKKLPVMVWIYGGGFVNGGSSPAAYSGEKFAEKGIVFVSFNYRLGRFGFFAHPALTAAHEGPLGNYGLMDQIAALKWVRKNIAAFGGDPHQVTVFGESAGGGSTLMILTSRAARGLFERVAVMSGGGRGSLMPMRQLSKNLPGVPSAETIGMNFAKGVGIDGVGPGSLGKLRALSSEQVLQGLNMASMASAAGTSYVGGPIEDGTIVTAAPDAIIASGEAANVPIMIGSNTADIGFSDIKTKQQAFASFGSSATRARQAYDPNGDADAATVTAMVAADRIMSEPARHIATLMTNRGQTAWYYRFGYVASSMRSAWPNGAPHATDIPYAFDTVAAKYGGALTAQDEHAAQLWNSYFANFGKTGDPNGPGLPFWGAYRPAYKSPVMLITSQGKAVGGGDPWQARLDVVENAHGEIGK